MTTENPEAADEKVKARVPQQRHLFIVTYGRSGSTLLQNLLNSIPGYEIRGENNNALFHYFRAWAAIRGSQPLRGMRRMGVVSDQTHPWFGGEKISPDRLGCDLVRNFVLNVLNPSDGVTVTGFKEIRFHTHPKEFEPYLNFIHRFFPGAQFLFNTRAHESVMRSGWWAERDPEAVRPILQRADALFGQYIEKYPERSCLVHYDDYVGQPEKLRPVFEFLGEAHDAQMVQRVMATRLDHVQNRRTSG